MCKTECKTINETLIAVSYDVHIDKRLLKTVNINLNSIKQILQLCFGHWSLSTGNGHFQHLLKKPVTDQSKICSTDYVGRTTKWAKVHNDRLWGGGSLMGEVVD
jgi:hypothetical protein